MLPQFPALGFKFGYLGYPFFVNVFQRLDVPAHDVDQLSVRFRLFFVFFAPHLKPLVITFSQAK
jgi:hypothetical protein